MFAKLEHFQFLCHNNKKVKTLSIKGEEIIDMKKIDLNNVNIGDLMEIHKRKIEVTKKEQIEEKRKIFI